jgi:hypothetical protein
MHYAVRFYRSITTTKPPISSLTNCIRRVKRFAGIDLANQLGKQIGQGRLQADGEASPRTDL